MFMYSYFYVRSVYSVSLCCSTYCLCVNVYCITGPGANPTAVNNYIISYSIKCLEYKRLYWASSFSRS